MNYTLDFKKESEDRAYILLDGSLLFTIRKDYETTKSSKEQAKELSENVGMIMELKGEEDPDGLIQKLLSHDMSGLPAKVLYQVQSGGFSIMSIESYFSIKSVCEQVIRVVEKSLDMFLYLRVRTQTYLSDSPRMTPNP